MRLLYLDTLKSLGSGPATKFVLPLELSNLARSLSEYAAEAMANK